MNLKTTDLTLLTRFLFNIEQARVTLTKYTVAQASYSNNSKLITNLRGDLPNPL